ncbi:AbiV family abortive infection protein [Patescibacteria group bacterium]|nr:AbiV family abortive infection protein [Patescibacteria group bacterium]
MINVTPNKKDKLTDYELFVITIFQNATQKLISAVALYSTKYSYNEAYFLSIIAQEELSKLIILPIARELGEIDEIINNRSSVYYKHSVKQKIFTNFGLQNRTHEDLERIKQSCLYVGVNSKHKPSFSMIKPDVTLKEIKHTVLFFVNNYSIILREETFSKEAKKGVDFFMKIIHGCIIDKLPEVDIDIKKDVDDLHKMTRSELEDKIHKKLLTNPYELIRIFKAVFKENYKKHLKEIGYFSIPELEKYIEKINVD